MVKKICMALSVLALLPLTVDAKPYKGGDRELWQLEDMLDREANQLMSRSNGSDMAIGIIGAIADLATRKERGKGGPGWHPGYGRQHRKVICVAQNARRQQFRAEGYVQGRVADRALRTCHHFSKDRRDRFDRLAKSCRVVSCRPGR